MRDHENYPEQVLSVDVGYGNTKFIETLHEDGSMDCDLIPSIALQPESNSIKSPLIHLLSFADDIS